MRYISIESVEPGHVLARSIYASDGRVLLKSGVELTVGMINKLRNIGVTALYIMDQRFDDIVLNDVVSEETRREAVKNLAEIVQYVQSGSDFKIKNLQQSAENIISQVLVNKDVLLDLTDVRTVDNHEFVHALNVCLISTVIGLNLNLSHNQLYDLALGALLHDIGKWVKEEPSAASGESQHHAWKGFQYLRKKHEVSILSAHVALQHHEFIDGTGAPRGLSGDEIHLYGKIVAVANFYDHLISPFKNEKPLPPYLACETLMGLAGKKFEHEIVRQFLRSVAAYPTGSSVKLSTGEIAVVVDQHKGLPSRPVLRLFRNQNEEELPEVKEIDLARNPTIFIEKILP